MEYINPALRFEFREFCVSLYLRQIDDIFTMAELTPGVLPQNPNVSGDRRSRVQEYYEGIDWGNINDARKFLKVIGMVLSQSYIDPSQRSFLTKLCENSGLVVDGTDIFLSDGQGAEENLFKRQFPVGLPFGISKPSFAITASNDRQSLKYEVRSGQGLIKDDVYPDFSFTIFQEKLDIVKDTNRALRESLWAMNQTEHEKKFMRTYAEIFNMVDRHVPLMIPQAWIQWHSETKPNLREHGSSHADELYRLDFVAFWKNKRYAVLIDDISHYGRKLKNQWLANPERYSMRLKEDRRLQKQGWYVFRVSNWEIENDAILKEILSDFGEFIGLTS